MNTRRSFLAAISSLPFLGWLKLGSKIETVHPEPVFHPEPDDEWSKVIPTNVLRASGFINHQSYADGTIGRTITGEIEYVAYGKVDDDVAAMVLYNQLVGPALLGCTRTRHFVSSSKPLGETCKIVIVKFETIDRE